MLPEVSTEAMNRFLADVSRTVSADTHVVLVLDGAGWQASQTLGVPANLSLLRLPPNAPELNPGVWLYLRERHLSHRLHRDDEAIVDAACNAWRQLTPQGMRSLCGYHWIAKIISWTRRNNTWRQHWSRGPPPRHYAM